MMCKGIVMNKAKGKNIKAAKCSIQKAIISFPRVCSVVVVLV